MNLPRRRFARWLAALSLAPAALPVAGARRLPLAPTLPVRDSRDPVAAAVLDALLRRQPLALYYHGGATPGACRRFRPEALYRHRAGGPIYAHGYCELRQATRTLRLDRARLA
mgnify:CR=1 FL=1